jgi:hypothetical protein
MCETYTAINRLQADGCMSRFPVNHMLGITKANDCLQTLNYSLLHACCLGQQVLLLMGVKRKP